jgi:hypothetical protein
MQSGENVGTHSPSDFCLLTQFQNDFRSKQEINNAQAGTDRLQPQLAKHGYCFVLIFSVNNFQNVDNALSIKWFHNPPYLS